jgi:hypothetical protein
MTENVIQLWHGGRNLEYSTKEFQGANKNRWEHGPGLYLTTHYDTARDYAKGGGKTYLIDVPEGSFIHEVNIPVELANEFVSRHIIGKKQKELLQLMYENMHRKNNSTHINAENFLNLIFNLNAIQTPKTRELNQFLVEQGVDYGWVNNFKGRNETVLVIYNFAKIKKITSVMAKDVDLHQRELPFFNREYYPSIKKNNMI